MKRSPLPRPTFEQWLAWQRKPRNPLPRVGRKRDREWAALHRCRAEVIERSSGWCEASSPACPSYRHGALDVHHIWPSDRDAGRHDAARCLHVCVVAHRWIHENPEEAYERGLLARYLTGAT